MQLDFFKFEFYVNLCYSTKLLVPRNGTNVEERINIENNLNLVYNIDYVI